MIIGSAGDSVCLAQVIDGASELYFRGDPHRVLDRLPPGEGLRSGCAPACTAEARGDQPGLSLLGCSHSPSMVQV